MFVAVIFVSCKFTAEASKTHRTTGVSIGSIRIGSGWVLKAYPRSLGPNLWTYEDLVRLSSSGDMFFSGTLINVDVLLIQTFGLWFHVTVCRVFLLLYF